MGEMQSESPGKIHERLRGPGDSDCHRSELAANVPKPVQHGRDRMRDAEQQCSVGHEPPETWSKAVPVAGELPILYHGPDLL